MRSGWSALGRSFETRSSPLSFCGGLLREGLFTRAGCLHRAGTRDRRVGVRARVPRLFQPVPIVRLDHRGTARCPAGHGRPASSSACDRRAGRTRRGPLVAVSVAVGVEPIAYCRECRFRPAGAVSSDPGQSVPFDGKGVCAMPQGSAHTRAPLHGQGSRLASAARGVPFTAKEASSALAGRPS